MQISSFQGQGGVPGEDFCMQNQNLQSKINNSINQMRKVGVKHSENAGKSVNRQMFNKF